jgi:hypothetical protein
MDHISNNCAFKKNCGMAEYKLGNEEFDAREKERKKGGRKEGRKKTAEYEQRAYVKPLVISLVWIGLQV